jgi:diphosphate-dependent phosphofructokinase
MPYSRDSKMPNNSPFIVARAKYKPRFPKSLINPEQLKVEYKGLPEFVADKNQQEKLKTLFADTYDQELISLSDNGGTKLEARAMTVGVVLSGGQAPGGHNVICGIYDALKKINPNSKLLGFKDGPGGILTNTYLELNDEIIDSYRNTGGFDMLGSGRTKIESVTQFTQCGVTLDKHRADALVIIGGDDSNTNAALLANYFKKEKSPIQVIGIPKTIDGDLKNKYIEISFGFDTAVRLYSDIISNLGRDVLSSKKHYHFVRLMGRSASHITLEAAFQTTPNIALIGEEIAENGTTLKEIVEEISNVIITRAELGKNYGIILIPEGVVEFIPEMKVMIEEINQIISEHKEHFEKIDGFTGKNEWVNGKLGKDASYTFSSLPVDIQREFLMERDPHGNVQVSLIETEKLLIEMVSSYLAEQKTEGGYDGKFRTQSHFLGYEGRCAAPTNFDADYGYSLGRTGLALISAGVTGYMAVIKNLASDRSEWQAMGVPLVCMMNLETRNGKEKPVIRKGLVELNGKPMAHFKSLRKTMPNTETYRFAGSIQYFGPEELCDRVPLTLALEHDKVNESNW